MEENITSFSILKKVVEDKKNDLHKILNSSDLQRTLDKSMIINFSFYCDLASSRIKRGKFKNMDNYLLFENLENPLDYMSCDDLFEFFVFENSIYDKLLSLKNITQNDVLYAVEESRVFDLNFFDNRDLDFNSLKKEENIKNLNSCDVIDAYYKKFKSLYEENHKNDVNVNLGEYSFLQEEERIR